MFSRRVSVFLRPKIFLQFTCISKNTTTKRRHLIAFHKIFQSLRQQFFCCFLQKLVYHTVRKIEKYLKVNKRLYLSQHFQNILDFFHVANSMNTWNERAGPSFNLAGGRSWNMMRSFYVFPTLEATRSPQYYKSMLVEESTRLHIL